MVAKIHWSGWGFLQKWILCTDSTDKWCFPVHTFTWLRN
jgi:hypothetical protein